MNPHSSVLSRRRFLATGAAALGSAPLLRLRAQDPSPNAGIAIGIVGCGGMGVGNMTNFLGLKGVRVVAVCDVDTRARNGAKAKVDGHYGNADCKDYERYPELLAHPGLDAICLSTPDHSHALIAVAAAGAGLDIFGEKPLTWGLAEGRQLVDAVTANQRIWQTGSWQRSGGEFRRFRALIRNHTLGKISRIECGTPPGMSIRQHVPNERIDELCGKAPAGIDWDGWCAPVTGFEYHPMLHPWNWRWHNTFGGGQLLDWVGHHVDIAMWSLDLDRTGPAQIEGTGTLGEHKFFNAYVQYSYAAKFADGQVIEVRSDFGGTKITGENGWLHVNRGRLNASDPELLRNLPEDFDTRPPSHWQNFIDCMRSRRMAVSDAESAHRAASVGQLAIVAIDSGQPLRWDPVAEKVLDNPGQAAHPRLGSRMAG